jgi:ATP-binding cassette subfamily F protein uup
VRNLASGQGIGKGAGGRTLFSKLNFGIEEGERIGLIGPNGAGKSTLLKILARQIQPDEGTLSWSQGLRVACLDQVPRFPEKQTVFEALMSKARDPDDGETMGRAYELLSKLGFLEEGYDENTPVARLSGGWVKRVALGREIMTEPDLLLLDEPTNHLDVESIEWLEEYLDSLRCTTLTVTHDRYFLNRVSNVIWELDPRNPGGLLVVRGSYGEYCRVRDELIDAQHRREAVLRNTFRRESEWLARGPAARTTKQKARINRAEEMIDTVSEVVSRNKVRQAEIEFHSIQGGPKRLLEARGTSKAYGERRIFDGLDLTLMAGTKLGLLGRNGAGKSTLLRVLLGKEAPDTGEVVRADHLKISYFEQARESLDPSQTVQKALCPEGDYVKFGGNYVHIRTYMEKFLFTDEFARKKISQLSGGEQARLLIAKLMLTEANLLVLDEPTNDLDLVTLGVLEESLREYPGALLVVSHDRYFLEQISTQFLYLDHGQATFVSSLDQWHALRAARERAAAMGIKTAASAPAAAASSEPAKPLKKLSYKDQRELEQMEQTILNAEREVDRLSRAVNSPEPGSKPSDRQKNYDGLAKAQSEVERLYARWAELEAMQKG